MRERGVTPKQLQIELFPRLADAIEFGSAFL
jgi:hypothetical protein